MGQIIKRFYKTNEDENFVEIKSMNKEATEVFRLEPKSDNGCWRQKSTGKRFYRFACAATFANGLSDLEDYEWIEY